jgi:hypothetical protein
LRALQLRKYGLVKLKINAVVPSIAQSSVVRLMHALLTAAALTPMVSSALSPARDENILCESTDVVVATVLKAIRSDPAHVDAACGYQPWNCSPGYLSSCQSDPHRIALRVRVSDVLGTKVNQRFESSPWYTRAEHVKISVGDTIDVTTYLFNDVCQPGIEDHQGWFSVNPPNKGISPAESVSPNLLRRFYVGKQFVFSLKAIRLIDLAPNSPFEDQPPGTFSSDIWRTTRLSWVKNTLQGSQETFCPKRIPSVANGHN